MTDTTDSAPTTPLGTRLRDLAELVDEALYSENDRGGEARSVLHQLYMDLVAFPQAGDHAPISGWERPQLEARADAIRKQAKRGDLAWTELHKVYLSTLTFDDMLADEEPVTAGGLASGIRARLADLETERDEARALNSDLAEKLRQRDAEFAAERRTRSDANARLRETVSSLQSEVRQEREAKEAALRQLAASTARERELEAQVARLSNGKADDAKDPVEELLREGVDGFLRMLGKLG